MYKIIKQSFIAILLIIVVYALIFPNIVLSQGKIDPTDPITEPIDTPLPVGKEHYLDMINYFAEKYSVSSSKMIKIMDCENRAYDPLLQSGIRYTAGQIARNPSWGEVGDYEKSFGLVQIHLPAKNKWQGKIITKEQAQDPEFSIEFLAERLSKGKGKMWTCYSK
jgi:hypothetical protein